MKKEYKFATEGFVNIYLSKYQILQQQELAEFVKTQKMFEGLNNCNIYFILKRPRITINPNYFSANIDYLDLEFNVQVKNKIEKRNYKLPNFFPDSNIELVSEYPHNYFELKNNATCLKIKTAILLDDYQSKKPFNDDILDFEVLYIGQSYGTTGNKNATDRIISHSTLQKIYLDTITNSPDSEIWIMLASFNQDNFVAINGKIKTRQNNNEAEVDRYLKFANAKFSEKQKINFTEAALINSFKPKYNKEFKNTFPSNRHIDYDECYKLDINGIMIELDLSEINRWLYSEAKPRILNPNGHNYWQSDIFYFNNREDRYQMFNSDYF